MNPTSKTNQKKMRKWNWKIVEGSNNIKIEMYQKSGKKPNQQKLYAHYHKEKSIRPFCYGKYS